MTKIVPRVLNKRRETGGVFVGRPTKWGNPFIMPKDGNREEVVEKFRVYLQEHPELVLAAKQELRNRNLVCFCAPLACHGDILLKIANED